MRSGYTGFVAVVVGGGLTVVAAVAAYVYFVPASPTSPTIHPGNHLPGAAVQGRIRSFCSECHAYSPPESFPKSAWKEEVERAFQFFDQSGIKRDVPAMAEVIRYFEDQAPDELPPAQIDNATGPPPVSFQQIPVAG